MEHALLCCCFLIKQGILFLKKQCNSYKTIDKKTSPKNVKILVFKGTRTSLFSNYPAARFTEISPRETN